MPFISADMDKVVGVKRKNEPDFKRAWDDSREEYR